jgi:hypothetical protein
MPNSSKFVKSWRQLAAEVAQETDPDKLNKLTRNCCRQWKQKSGKPMPALSLLRATGKRQGRQRHTPTNSKSQSIAQSNAAALRGP